MEISAEDSFRIRSYRTAAGVIEGYPEQMASILKDPAKKLTDIAGIGKGIASVIEEIEDFIDSNGTVIGGSLGAAAATGLGAPVLVELIPLLLLILAFLLAFLAATQAAGQSTLGDVFDDLRGGLLNDPVTRPAGILVWRAIVSKVWESQQSPHDYAAISYAIMDTHNYRDLSCAVNVRSLEVFFDAADPALVTFVDRLLKFEIDQEFQHGHSVAGYVSLRFCGQTSALIGQERFARTVAIECSGLADVNGSIQFVDFAENYLGVNVIFWSTRSPWLLQPR